MPRVTKKKKKKKLAIGVSEGRYIASDDVPMAYITVASDRKRIYMKLNKSIVAIIKRHDPNFAEYVDSDGMATVEIIAALYGLSDSSGLWYEEISSFLKSLGFVENDVEKCVFNKIIDGKQCTILLYVDDMLCMHISPKLGQIKFTLI